MPAVRVITYIGLLNALILVAVWHGARFYLVDLPNMRSGTTYINSISDINPAQAFILVYTIVVAGVFVRTLFSIKRKVSKLFWILVAVILVVLGLTQSFYWSFVTLLGFGYAGLLLGLAPSVIASALLISLLAMDSPINLTRLWRRED